MGYALISSCLDYLPQASSLDHLQVVQYEESS